MKENIDRIIGDDDPFINQLIKEYMNLLKRNGLLGIISFQTNDLYFAALSNEDKLAGTLDDLDILIDSY